MRQHFLPKFYLQGFVSPLTELGHQPHAWVYFLEDRTWKKRAPRNIASETDLYSFALHDGSRNDAFEQFLSVVEGKASKVIKLKITEGQDLDDEDRKTLSYFLAFMYVRQPIFLDTIANCIGDVAKKCTLLWASDPKAFKQHFGFDHDLIDWDKAKIEPPKDKTLYQACKLTEKVAPLFADMFWTFFVAPAGMPLVTSDWPLVAIDPELPPGPYGAGIGSKTVGITLPLSSSVAIYMAWASQPPSYSPAADSVIRCINQRTMRWAKQFIVSPSRHFLGSEFLGR